MQQHWKWRIQPFCHKGAKQSSRSSRIGSDTAVHFRMLRKLIFIYPSLMRLRECSFFRMRITMTIIIILQLTSNGYIYNFLFYIFATYCILSRTRLATAVSVYVGKADHREGTRYYAAKWTPHPSYDDCE